MAIGVSDFNETEAFEEYNSHPYKGGYDIVLTYGTPLPPSPAICYPISDASSYPPLRPQVPLPSVPVEPPALPESIGKSIPNSAGREEILPEAEYGSSYGYGERNFTTLDWWGNLSGFSPYMMAADGNGHCGCRYDAQELKYWGQLRRAADYIFGYSQGFGERRIGVDSLGIPIYAYKRRGNDTIHMEIEPARTEKVDYHCDSLHHEQCSSTYNNREDENHRFSNLFNTYVKHHPEEPLLTEVDPIESVFSWIPIQTALHEDQVVPERKLVPLYYDESRDEDNLHRNLGLDFNTHCYGGSQNVQMEASEGSYAILNYPEASREISYTDSIWEPSYEGHEDVNNTINNSYYEGRGFQQPSHHELESYRPSWAQYPAYYGIYEETSDYSEIYHESSPPRSTWVSRKFLRYQTSSLGEWINEEMCCNLEYASCDDDDSLVLEPFKPTWMLNPNYYGTYEEISAPLKQVTHHTLKDETTYL